MNFLISVVFSLRIFYGKYRLLSLQPLAVLGPPEFGSPATEAIVKKPVASSEPSEKNWNGVKELT